MTRAAPLVALALAPAIAALGSLVAPSLHVSEAVADGLAFAGALATVVVPLALACRAKIPGRATLVLAAAGVATVAIAAISRPAAPIAVVLVDAGLVVAASAIGGAIGTRIAHPGHLLPACAVAAAADVASLAEGPTRAIAESERALSILALGFAVPGTHFVAPAIGFGDALFLALVLGCAAAHGLGVARVALLGALGLATAGVLSARFELPIPALVPLALAIVLGVPRARKLRDEDKKTTMVAAVLAGTIAGALLLRRLLLG